MKAAPGEMESCLLVSCGIIVHVDEREGEVVIVAAEPGHLRDMDCLFINHPGQHKQAAISASGCL